MVVVAGVVVTLVWVGLSAGPTGPDGRAAGSPGGTNATASVALVSIAPTATPAVVTMPPGTPGATPSANRASTPAVQMPLYLDAREAPCPENRFTCVTLRVPRDHFASQDGGVWSVTFAIQRASGTRTGVWVTATGGPGTSGLASAESYTDAFDPKIPETYDIVFFDQRGIGLSQPIQCPDAAAAYYQSTARPQDPAQAAAAMAAAKDFTTGCLAESNAAADDLPYYSTRQAVEDLEAFRSYLGIDKLDLYGESYGTQYVQTYAATHPDRVHSLFLDGAVDLTRSITDFYSEQAKAFDLALVGTLLSCANAEACTTDLAGAKELGIYDALAARLGGGPLTYEFPLPNGHAATRQFTIADLENAASGFVYGQYGRMQLQRAMAAASRDDLVALARLAYSSLGIDSGTLEVIPDPTWSDAMYYAVECLDYAYGSGTGDERAQLYLDAGTAAGMADERMGTLFYGDLPCAYWPVRVDEPRPAPLTQTAYPVFVLGASLDPATPYSNAVRIYERLNDAYLITQSGGPHVIYGRGNACPDDLVTAFLVDGTRPPERRTTCPGPIADDYVAVPAAAASDYADPLAIVAAVDDQLVNLPEYNDWDASSPLAIGCDQGGSARFRPSGDDYLLTLSACAFTDGLPLTGSGRIDAEGAMALEVRLPAGTLTYRHDAEGNRSVRGTYHGAPVDLKR